MYEHVYGMARSLAALHSSLTFLAYSIGIHMSKNYAVHKL